MERYEELLRGIELVNDEIFKAEKQLRDAKAFWFQTKPELDLLLGGSQRLNQWARFTQIKIDAENQLLEMETSLAFAKRVRQSLEQVCSEHFTRIIYRSPDN